MHRSFVAVDTEVVRVTSYRDIHHVSRTMRSVHRCNHEQGVGTVQMGARRVAIDYAEVNYRVDYRRLERDYRLLAVVV